MPSLSARENWRLLGESAASLEETPLASLFATDPQRFSRYSIEAAGLFLDYSKNLITEEVIGQLLALASECELADQVAAMFSGQPINTTEQRAVLHTALRSQADSLMVDGTDVMPLVREQLARMGRFVDQVRSGQWRGSGGRPITDVVNIGIGGSDLGPKMVVEALADPTDSGVNTNPVKVHFVSNVDGEHLLQTLASLDGQSTLFVVTSKTFTTLETLTNARSARRWLIEQIGSDQGLEQHFVAVSSNAAAVAEFGIAEANRFEIWDWVGGRYSLWSAVGLGIALAGGMEQFNALLAGARRMDHHFLTAPMEQNMPVILGLIGIWNRNFLDIPSLMVMPYDQRLASFSAYLQQADMESNGKSVTLDGQPLAIKTAPVVWGAAGTNGQHAYMQLLHQGNERVASDFIVAIQPREGSPFADHHPALVANCFAQAEALMVGRSRSAVESRLLADGLSQAAAGQLAPHLIMPGGRPSNTLMMERLTAETLGALIALYEQKIFVQGALWGINSFDQWGVELGKKLAAEIIDALGGDGEPDLAADRDSSTAGLVQRYRQTLAGRSGD